MRTVIVGRLHIWTNIVLACVNGGCTRCSTNKYDDILDNDQSPGDIEVKYKRLVDLQGKSKLQKSTKCKVGRLVPIKWKELKQSYKQTLKKFLLHNFEVKQQLYARRYITKNSDGVNFLCLSISFRA